MLLLLTECFDVIAQPTYICICTSEAENIFSCIWSQFYICNRSEFSDSLG
jgi:hypothetical protein